LEKAERKAGKDELFPIKDEVSYTSIGHTTLEQFRASASYSSYSQSDYYHEDGPLLSDRHFALEMLQFGFNKGTNVMDQIQAIFRKRDHPASSTITPSYMPLNWMKIGFQWDASFNQWVKAFLELEYDLRVSVEPHVHITDQGERIFEATLVAYRIHEKKVSVKIEVFFYGFPNSQRGQRHSPNNRDTMGGIVVSALSGEPGNEPKLDHQWPEIC